MNKTSPLPEDALLAGATGLVGHELSAQWPGPGTLHLLVRRPVPSAAGRQAHVVDFAALPALPQATLAFCCLGTTIKVAGSQAAFRAVDVDAVLAFAQAARRAGVRRFAAVSALGADSHSATFYNRVKGETEQALRGVGFEQLVLARPSLLAGARESLGQPARPAERLTLRLTAPLAPFIPKAWRPIEAATVARAMLRALHQGGAGVQVLESKDLQDLGRA